MDWKRRIHYHPPGTKIGKSQGRHKKKKDRNMSGWKDQYKTVDKSDNETWRDKSKEYYRTKGDLKDIETESSNKNKTGHSKITKESSTK